MSETDCGPTEEVRQPEPPLPEDSGLTDELSAVELKATVDVESHNLHYHLDELVDVGLVDKRQRRTADSKASIRTTDRQRWDMASSSTALRD